MGNLILTSAISFIVAYIIAKPIIRKLQQMKFGQKILEDGPTWHMSKQYTPTMGGWIFIISIFVAIVVAMLVNGDFSFTSADFIVATLALVYGIIGAIDDMAKIKKKQNEGLTAIQKLLLQIGASAIFITVMRNLGYIEPEIFIPFLKINIAVNWILYLCFAVFAIVAIVNAVNLTDGIDGLATSVTMVVSLFFIAVYTVSAKAGVVVPLRFAFALLGGLLAFYLYNKFPARVFMGDTGSLFLGGAVAGMAFAINAPFAIVTVGIIYVIETTSVIIQVAYFKATGGKRFFKMTPIHHHFEMCGWSEQKIGLVFSLVTLIASIITYFGM